MVNFQDSLAPTKQKPPKVALLRADFSWSKRAEPRNTATVGKKRAPQKVLVMETGSEGGGRFAALVEPSDSAAAAILKDRSL